MAVLIIPSRPICFIRRLSMQVARGLKLYFIHFSEGHAFSTSGICPILFAGHVQVNLIDFDPGMLLPEW